MIIGENKMTASDELQKKYGFLTIGNVLKSIRISEKIKQDVMAKKLGIHKRELSAIENERLIPSIEFTKKAAKQLGAHPKHWTIILHNQLKKESFQKKDISLLLPASEYLKFLSQKKKHL